MHVFKFNPIAASRHLEKAVPLGPNGILQRAFVHFLVLFFCLLTLSYTAKYFFPEIFLKAKPSISTLLIFPFIALVLEMSMGIWRYLFRLANYIQTLRDFSVPNIEHLRLRLADLTPSPTPGSIDFDPPIPAATVPRPLDQESKPLGTKERNTLLAIIGVLCKEAHLDHTKPSKTAALIQSAADQMGIALGETTIEGHLKKVPDALLTRMK